MKENQNPKAIYLADYTPPAYWVDKVSLSFSLHEQGTQVISRLQMRRNTEGSDNPAPDIVLNGVDVDLKRFVINGEEVQKDNLSFEDETLIYKPHAEQIIAKDGEGFELEIETLIYPENNTALEGLYVSKGMYCTQCEAHGFRRITYYPDRPDVMAEFDVYIEADKSQYPVLLSNGNPVDQGELENNRHWAKWHDPFRKPCYLFALVAGDLECVRDEFIRASGKPVSLELYVETQDLDKCGHAMESLKNAMRWDEQVFGREYDLDIYMIVAVSHFNMGAMENKGLNIFNTSCVLANPKTTSDLGFERVEGVVAHEYFHNWSGNRVTCRDWFQLSLKEGFTVFRDEEFSSDMGSRTVKRIDDVNILRNFQFKEDAGPMAHPVRPASYIEMNNFYTVTVYNKGAEVVRMLHTILGAQQFRKACDLYFERYDGQAVTCDDFVGCMEVISGMDLTQFKRWYSQAGTPKLEVSSRYDDEHKKLEVGFKQSCPGTPGQDDKQDFVIPVRIALFDKSTNQKMTFSIEGAKQEEALLLINKSEQYFVMDDVEADAIPSLLRNFSAPVKLEYDYSFEDLAFLMANDDDGFNAWDAGQSLYMRSLKHLVTQYENQEALSFAPQLKGAISDLLERTDMDKALLARMLSLPTKAYLAEQYSKINADAVVAAHNFLEHSIAESFYSRFLELYQQNITEEAYEPVFLQMAQRSIKNVCLRYLCLTENKEALALASAQFEQADNMTDQGSAFRAVVNFQHQEYQMQRSHIIQTFYDSWRHEALVLDQWFSVQASALKGSSAIEGVQRLVEHDDYDNKNPNRVRSVLAAFAQNYEAFHAADGSGYRFFAEQIAELNAINPQIAARLVSTLVHWKRYQGERGKVMKDALQKLKAMPDVSKDVYEIVEKALA